MCNRIKQIFLSLLVFVMAAGLFSGCDSGNKAVERAAGKQAVEQFKETKDQLNALERQQKEKYQNLPGDDASDGKSEGK